VSKAKWLRSLVLVTMVASLLAVCWSSPAFADGTAQLRRRTLFAVRWYVQLEIKGLEADLWFRASPNASSNGDVRVLHLVLTTPRLDDAKGQICRAVQTYQRGKLVVGCASVVGTAACYYPVGPLAAVCGASVTYGVSSGYLDCATGLVSAIASKLGRDAEWIAAAESIGASKASLQSVVKLAAQFACSDAKPPK
jgi:hypothetical protein